MGAIATAHRYSNSSYAHIGLSSLNSGPVSHQTLTPAPCRMSTPIVMTASLDTKIPALLAKHLWTPHPTLSDEQSSIVSKFVQKLPELHCEQPMDGEQYLWPNHILD